MSKQIRRRCTGHVPGSMTVTVEFILDTSQSPYNVRTIFRYRNGGTEWDIPLAMFAVLFTKHEVELEDVRLCLDVDQIRIALTGEGESDKDDDVTVEVVLPLDEVLAFYNAADKVT